MALELEAQQGRAKLASLLFYKTSFRRISNEHENPEWFLQQGVFLGQLSA